MNKKSLLILIALGAFALSAPFLVVLQGQSAEKVSLPTAKSPQQTHDEIKGNFPSVEYTTERSTDESRQRKSAKYDKYKVLDPNIYKDSTEVSFAHWLPTESPLPVAESEIVLLGKVSDAHAYLSSNKNSVYSEFKIDIEKIFKNSSNDDLDGGKSVVVERDGGIVSFPTGFKTWYLVSGQQMPSVGSRYLFFLTHQFTTYGPQDKDLFLLTAYELTRGKVTPLDNPSGGSHPIATFYKGKDESVLLKDLSEALKNSKKTLRN